MKLIALILTMAVSGQLFFGTNQPTALHTPAAPADSLEEYVGTYNFKDGMFNTYTITLKDGALQGEADSYGVYKLIKKEKPDVFQSTSQYASIITFKRNPDTKKVTGLSLLIQETEMNAEKK
jgi:Domain of unknown function (DUF3471)